MLGRSKIQDWWAKSKCTFEQRLSMHQFALKSRHGVSTALTMALKDEAIPDDVKPGLVANNVQNLGGFEC